MVFVVPGELGRVFEYQLTKPSLLAIFSTILKASRICVDG